MTHHWIYLSFVNDKEKEHLYNHLFICLISTYPSVVFQTTNNSAVETVISLCIMVCWPFSEHTSRANETEMLSRKRNWSSGERSNTVLHCGSKRTLDTVTAIIRMLQLNRPVAALTSHFCFRHVIQMNLILKTAQRWVTGWCCWFLFCLFGLSFFWTVVLLDSCWWQCTKTL